LNVLKLDIEGSEREVFSKNYEEWLKKTQNIIVEIHPHLNTDAHSIIASALKDEFIERPAGEYHFYYRKNN
jgi:hypothetical protein